MVEKVGRHIEEKIRTEVGQRLGASEPENLYTAAQFFEVTI